MCDKITPRFKRKIRSFIKDIYLWNTLGAHWQINISHGPFVWYALQVILIFKKVKLDYLKSIPFAHPMTWRELKDHINDCYFCLCGINGLNTLKRCKYKYLNLESSLQPVPHCDYNNIHILIYNTFLMNLFWYKSFCRL